VSTADRRPASGVRTSCEKSEMKLLRVCSRCSVVVTSRNRATAAMSSYDRGSARISILRSATPEATEKRTVDSLPASAASKVSKTPATRRTSPSVFPATSVCPNSSPKRRLAKTTRRLRSIDSRASPRPSRSCRSARRRLCSSSHLRSAASMRACISRSLRPPNMSTRRRIVSVAESDHRADAIESDLAPQIADVSVDGPRLDVVRRLPHFREDPVAGDHRGTVLHQKPQQLEFLARQLDLLSLPVNAERLPIDRQLV